MFGRATDEANEAWNRIWESGGQGVYMEDIQNEICPSTPMLRTQSMPDIANAAPSFSLSSSASHLMVYPEPSPSDILASPDSTGFFLANSPPPSPPLSHNNQSPPTFPPSPVFTQLTRTPSEPVMTTIPSTLNTYATTSSSALRSHVHDIAEETEYVDDDEQSLALSKSFCDSDVTGHVSTVSPPLHHHHPHSPALLSRQLKLHELAQAQVMKHWNVQQVCNWLQQVNMAQYVQLFMEHAINGKTLLELDEQDLRDELQITSRLQRKAFLAEVHAAKTCTCTHCTTALKSLETSDSIPVSTTPLEAQSNIPLNSAASNLPTIPAPVPTILNTQITDKAKKKKKKNKKSTEEGAIVDDNVALPNCESADGSFHLISPPRLFNSRSTTAVNKLVSEQRAQCANTLASINITRKDDTSSNNNGIHTVSSLTPQNTPPKPSQVYSSPVKSQLDVRVRTVHPLFLM